MNGDTCDTVILGLYFSRVNSGPDVETERSNNFANCGGTADCPSGSAESRQEAVSCRVDYYSTMAGDLNAAPFMILLKELCPTAVSDFCYFLRRACDVYKEDRRKNAFDLDVGSGAREEFLNEICDSGAVLMERKVIDAIELDKASSRDAPGQITPVLDRKDPVARCVKHQSGNADSRENRSDVGLKHDSMKTHGCTWGCCQPLHSGDRTTPLRVVEKTRRQSPQQQGRRFVSPSLLNHFQGVFERFPRMPEGIVFGSRQAGPRAVQNQGGGPFGVRRSKHGRPRAAICCPKECGFLQSGGCHDRDNIVDPMLERWPVTRWEAIRQAGAELIEQHHATKRREASAKLGKLRNCPCGLNVVEEPGNKV
jgi:hypothetical protein